MTSSAPISFYISDITRPVTEKSRLWEAPLPIYRPSGNAPRETIKPSAITYGDYFTAIGSFLSRNNFKPLHTETGQYRKCGLPDEKAEQVRIFLMKHGEYYHPAKIEARLGEKTLKRVINVAVSDAGQSFITKEFELLIHLKKSFPYSFIPEVYDFGKVLSRNGHPIHMFIGEWLDGFSEFHLSRYPESNKTGIVVWGEQDRHFFLDDQQTLQLFEGAAKILTAYYNLLTFEQIFSWHHAAGDFVIKIKDNRPAVRLVTVRQYGPLLKDPDSGLGAVLDGLLIFFLNLSIRMRIDRIDGVGDYALVGKPAVKGTVKGFFQGLDLQSDADRIPIELVEGFKTYLSSFKPEDLLNWSINVLNGFHPDTPGLDLIKENLQDHVYFLWKLIRDFIRSS